MREFDHPRLKQFSHNIEPNKYLFKQGDTASTMLFLVEGLIELRSEREGRESKLVSLVDGGQFLGEKALFVKGTYRRAFSALTKRKTRYLELTNANLDALENEDPKLMSMLLRKMFRTASLRLDRANFLAKVLRSSDNAKRCVQLIYYFSKSFGLKLGDTRVVSLTRDAFQNYIDIEEGLLDNCLNELLLKKLIIREDETHFQIPDDEKLLAFASKLSERLTTGYFDELESIPS